MIIRTVRPNDHSIIAGVMPEWWGGRDLSSALLKIFFIHFDDTCFVMEDNNELAGFLTGFLSQSDEHTAYIHLAGVNPKYRRQGVANQLYERFYGACRSKSVSIVQACTSPVNKLSISFHQGMGFAILPGDSKVEGIEVTEDYLSEGFPKVLFQIEI